MGGGGGKKGCLNISQASKLKLHYLNAEYLSWQIPFYCIQIPLIRMQYWLLLYILQNDRGVGAFVTSSGRPFYQV